ncbi:glycerophosphodiester phosphodiesterase [Halorussus sp. AFM4]|uniref:glycerophosphodiester phosphodiesterase n=1 Tax=Halorussus sp. AFM4 TaxID=3421651 RepID=UPI003EBC4891
MQLTAHRGFGDEYPENTVRAAREASRFADAVEIDVRRCGTGELVASHWENVELVTDGRGDVTDLSASDLAGLRVDGSDFGVPLLSEVLEVVPPDVGLTLDVKSTEVVADLLALLETVPNDVVISSFDPDPLWRTRMLEESMPLAYNFGLRPDANFLTAETIGVEHANVHWALCFLTDIVERAHEAGMDVHAWPVATRPLAWALDRRGVDGIVATRPLGRSARRERVEAEPPTAATERGPS